MKLKHALTAAVFLALVAVLAVMPHIAKTDFLPAERREPAAFPELTGEKIWNGKFMSGFENFAADAFWLRDEFRTVRSATVFGAFAQSDKSGLYNADGNVGKIEAVNAAQYRMSAEKLEKLAGMLPEDSRVYYAIIPDKIIYADRYFPGAFDIETAYGIFDPILTGAARIDLSDALSLDSFYPTDLHWDQTRLGGVLAALGEAMTGAVWQLPPGQPQEIGGFRGVYAGQLSLPLPRDEARVIPVPHVTAEYNIKPSADFTAPLEFIPGPVYDDGSDGGYDYKSLYFKYSSTEYHGFNSRYDPYELFLCGSPQRVIRLTNSEAAEDAKNLYVFRDSFTSSLGPLLAECGGYGTVTLIDLRSFASMELASLQIAPSSDVLFIYGSQILNNAANFNVN